MHVCAIMSSRPKSSQGAQASWSLGSPIKTLEGHFYHLYQSGCSHLHLLPARAHNILVLYIQYVLELDALSRILCALDYQQPYELLIFLSLQFCWATSHLHVDLKMIFIFTDSGERCLCNSTGHSILSIYELLKYTCTCTLETNTHFIKKLCTKPSTTRVLKSS